MEKNQEIIKNNKRKLIDHAINSTVGNKQDIGKIMEQSIYRELMQYMKK